MEISYGLAAKQALFRQEVTLNVMKQAAQQEQAVVSLIDQAVQNVAASGRGSVVNISA